MSADRGLPTGHTTTLILKLIEEKDMYGYEMIEALAKKSDHTFDLKAGTLYPIMHGLEKDGLVEAYEEKADNERTRKYYHLTPKGKNLLQKRREEWVIYSNAVNKVLNGGLSYAAV